MQEVDDETRLFNVFGDPVFFLPPTAFSQGDAIKLAEGVYAIKGHGAAMNTGFVVGERGVFVFACDPPDYDRRMRAIKSVAGDKTIRFVANGHHAGDSEHGGVSLWRELLAK